MPEGGTRGFIPSVGPMGQHLSSQRDKPEMVRWWFPRPRSAGGDPFAGKTPRVPSNSTQPFRWPNSAQDPPTLCSMAN